MAKSLRKEAIIEYQKINQEWLKFHFQVLLLCVAISAIFEIIIYFIIRFTGTMYDTNYAYWLKYIFMPISIGVVLALVAYIILQHKQIATVKKYYAVSILMMLYATNLSFVHSGYEAILFTFLLPILMTIMYEDRRLTGLITFFTLPLELFTGLSMTWDPYKEITHGFLVNLLIIMILTIVAWMVSYYMISFALHKKEVIIEKDVERQQLKEKILLDELTNVNNKNALFNDLKDLTKHNQTFHLAMMDIDKFKIINDHYGHLFGDEVLRCLGIALQDMRKECTTYRYGGDEFCVIIQDDDKEKIISDMEQLQADFIETLNFSKRKMTETVTISIGVSTFKEGTELLTLIKDADEALYESKKSLQNSITYHD